MTTYDTPSDGRTDGGELAATAAHGMHAVAEAGREAQATLAEQAGAVTDAAKDQFQSFVSQARSEFAHQADAQGQQVLRGLHTLTDELGALASGRPQEAGQLGTVVSGAQQRLARYVSSLDARGPQGIVDDVARFARRRPGMFLLGAGIAGFTIGRLVRSAAGAQSDGTSGNRPGASDWTSQPPLERRTAAAFAAPQEASWPTR